MMEQEYHRVGDTFVYSKLDYIDLGNLALVPEAMLEMLPEYSSSMPTGVFVNKVWKCHVNDPATRSRNNWSGTNKPGGYWLWCEYCECADPKRVANRRIPMITPPELQALAEALLWWLP